MHGPFPLLNWPHSPEGPRGRCLPETAGPSLVEPIVLDALVELTPDEGVFIEVGTWGGATVATLADRKPKVQFVSVDSFVSDRHRLLWLLNRRPNMRLFDGPSHCFWGMVGNCRANVIYIDGDHTKDGALRDLVQATRVIVPGNPILVHDYYNNDFIGVQGAVDDFCASEGWSIDRKIASLVILRKNEK